MVSNNYDELEKKIDNLEKKIDVLLKQNESHNGVPKQKEIIGHEN